MCCGAKYSTVQSYIGNVPSSITVRGFTVSPIHRLQQTQNLLHRASESTASVAQLLGVGRGARARSESVRVRVGVLRVRDADLCVGRVKHGVVALQPPESVCSMHQSVDALLRDDEIRTDEVEALPAVAAQIAGDEVDVARVATELGVQAARPDLRIRCELERRAVYGAV